MDNLYDTFVFLFESDSSSAQYENTHNLHQIILVLKDMTDSYLFFLLHKYYTTKTRHNFKSQHDCGLEHNHLRLLQNDCAFSKHTEDRVLHLVFTH